MFTKASPAPPKKIISKNNLIRSFVRTIVLYGTFLLLINCGSRQVTVESDPRIAQTTAKIVSEATPSPALNKIVDLLPPGFNSDLSVSEIGSSGFKINWERGSDLLTKQTELEYRVVVAETVLIDANCANAQLPVGVSLVTDWSKDLTKAALVNLSPATLYQVAVLVRDSSNNIALLGPRHISTSRVNAPITGTITSFTQTTATGVQLSWGAAQGVTTEPAKLRYRVVRAPSAVDIDALEEVISDPLASEVTLVTDWSENLTNLSVASLASGSTYYFAIAVRDVNDNYAIYPPIAMQTASAEIDMPGAASVTMGLTPAEVIITWPAATSNNNVNPAFQYKLVKAAAKTSIDSIAEIEAIVGDDVLTNWTVGELSKNISGLVYDIPYYFGILVRDVETNVAIYSPITYTALAPIVVPTSIAQNPTPTVAATPDDTTAPTVTIATSASNSTNVNPISFTATFSEVVTGFSVAGISVSNGAVSSLGGSGKNYSFTVIPNIQGIVSVIINGNAAQDAAGNVSAASNTLNIDYDLSHSSVEFITLGVTSFKTSPINLTISFSKNVTGFTSDDVVVSNSNGSVSSVSGSGKLYTATLTPFADGLITVNIAANSAFDGVNNGNLAATTLNLTYDTIAPIVTLSHMQTACLI